MGLLKFLSKLFTSTHPNADRVSREQHRLNILEVMSSSTEHDELEFFTTGYLKRALMVRDLPTWHLAEEFHKLLDELVSEGLVQKVGVHYVISDNGLNYIGLPGT